ncbi:ABC transporter substrate-binding protein [Paenibacillus filicis]|uniref:ABC transporter substrate-binding protein n=1 Tax=Paenibacillus filicis TaxID=669464 RepID=A0ABU9DEE3_9BACL
MSKSSSARIMKTSCALGTVLLLSAALASGCGTAKDPGNAATTVLQPLSGSSPQAELFPRTIDMEGQAIMIPSKPQRIAALSLDAAEAALELVDPGRMAVVPKSIGDPSLAYRTAEGAQVPGKIAGATSLDPEQILAYQADLLLMTKLHDKEREANELLLKSGIPIISLESWSTLHAVMNNIGVIGKSLGEDDKAKSITDEMRRKQDQVTKAVEGAVKPTVLVISPLGPGTGPYLIGPSNISYDLVRLAGGNHAADSLGLKRTTKATMEQIIKADPDYLLLVEWQEGKLGDIEEMLQTPGWSTLQAVQHDRVLRMPARKLLNPNRYNADTLQEIAKRLHPDKF